MTDEQKAPDVNVLFLQNLQKKGGLSLFCPRCGGGPSVPVGGQAFVHVRLDEATQLLPCGVMVCSKCGFASFHVLPVVLGENRVSET